MWRGFPKTGKYFNKQGCFEIYLLPVLEQIFKIYSCMQPISCRSIDIGNGKGKPAGNLYSFIVSKTFKLNFYGKLTLCHRCSAGNRMGDWIFRLCCRWFDPPVAGRCCHHGVITRYRAVVQNINSGMKIY